MITFEQARQTVQRRWPDYKIAPYGYEGHTDWFLVLSPETVGGRIPAVSKSTGAVRWINENADEYDQNALVGKPPTSRP